VHIDASLLVVGAMLTQNPTRKYASRLLNKVKQNYTSIEKETLAMVYAFYT
jgi:hypothetical protein